MLDRTPLWEQPRERLRREGAEALSLLELLAVVLRTGAPGASSLGVGAALVRRFGSIQRLARAADAEFLQVSGIGPAKIAALRAAFELGSRLAQAPLVPGDAAPPPAASAILPRRWQEVVMKRAAWVAQAALESWIDSRVKPKLPFQGPVRSLAIESA